LQLVVPPALRPTGHRHPNRGVVYSRTSCRPSPAVPYLAPRPRILRRDFGAWVLASPWAISARAWRASLRLSLRLSGSPCIATLRISPSGRGWALGGKAHFSASLLSHWSLSSRKASSSGARSPAQPGFRSRRSPRGRTLGLGGLDSAETVLMPRIPEKPICRGRTALATLHSNFNCGYQWHPSAAASHQILLAQSGKKARGKRAFAEDRAHSRRG
jgi:hypothetical protein